MIDRITLVYEPAEEGGYCVYAAEFPGVVSQGETLEEAREMALDALALMLEANRCNRTTPQNAGAISEQLKLTISPETTNVQAAS